MQNNPVQVFVYGTLKPNGKYYPIYCQGKTIKEEKCYTKGKLFALSLGYPAMIVGDDLISGFLLTFASENELVNLDKLEGYSGRKNDVHNEYERQKILVYNEFNQPLNYAWAYFMNEKKIEELKGVYIPSGCWPEKEERNFK